jgi:pimeloyl-ACP methyl ester carboxylesterase
VQTPPGSAANRIRQPDPVGLTSAFRSNYAYAVPETSYASCGDLSLAYQAFGDGPVELVFVGPFVSHIEVGWTMPEIKAFFDHLAMFCRVVVFDKAGVGLSDPVPHSARPGRRLRHGL